MTDIATLVEDSGAIKRGKFKLSTGEFTDYYIDKYKFETDPDLLSEVTDALVEMLSEENIDILAGPALGAVPLVTATSLATNIDAAFIRTGEKHRGTQARIEGPIEKGDRVAIVEDVSTTGRTILESASVIEEAGGIVDRLLVVVDRNEGAVSNVRDAGHELEYLAQVGSDFQVENAE